MTAKPEIILRRATIDDSEAIARAVTMAFGEDMTRRLCGDRGVEIFERIVRLDNTQYSYRNALVAEVDGVPAGAIIGYDGARLRELREQTFQVIRRHIDVMPSVEEETTPDEFYLDSVGVLPAFRGCGVGRKLIVALCDKAVAEGHTRIGLLVDFENPHAERLYLSLGFKRVEVKKFMGHDVWHLQYMG